MFGKERGEGGREGERREGGREGRKEGGREGGREGERKSAIYTHTEWNSPYSKQLFNVVVIMYYKYTNHKIVMKTFQGLSSQLPPLFRLLKACS